MYRKVFCICGRGFRTCVHAWATQSKLCVARDVSGRWFSPPARLFLIVFRLHRRENNRGGETWKHTQYLVSSEISDFTPCTCAQSDILHIKYAEKTDD